ncbi:MAG: hypothetical protein JSV26_05580 [bacterium]|nr:MAG: hypothetical protein JSV26_05580 [bacterium]
MVSLAEARQKFFDAKKQVMSGIDPAGVRDERREMATMAELADEYLTNWARKRKKTLRCSDPGDR